ncbi:alpha/beta fold hydrolase [Sulfitobacter sp. M57]|uniref:alpha/beta fold hydrolase n=1 Tax=unclassified Sulfitobacter TaxID=196795 RepID=UPI0023E08F51|nr:MULTISPECIES: alpha/beta fold hydrolase [unclassified Sulfitobacter]MDF3415851.1 alpha/beta fold hydrolase [Sulfitobacter sp. KE5]MDF3423331.1 alpha/beta fold hydrolase [Sulfitobacter sp. KE43]MDF3434397.1 alpha/beta fold hydrolase [Sulfitobacter sp. KE42]MDF3460037.1 alpha/beta fold hydrolase [Sulfitobacter sp. S74]MDF3463935.1 alpha/beta fold hydrolase [Sulfitobacter sp. Ks18]
MEDGEETDGQTLELVESIYRIALEPHAYDAFMGRWDTFVQDRLSALDLLRSEVGIMETSEIAAHFEIAERLLEQTRNVGEAQLLAPETRAAAGPDPQFLIDSSGGIVWSNAAAARAFRLKRTSRFDDLDLPDRYLKALEQRIATLGTESEHGDPPLIFQMSAVVATDGLAVGDMVHLQAQRLHEKLGSDLLLVGPLVAHWPPSMPKLLATTYGLSQSECEICELLSRAHRPKDVASYRKSSIATVRTQIKSLLVKTGCGSQTELVRLLHLLMRVAENYGPTRPAAPISQGKMTTVLLDSGILMPVEVHGPANGKPVIFLHGMLDGASLTLQTREALACRGFRFICPTRPWFGDAEPDYGPMDTAPVRIGKDVREMCEKMGIRNAVVLGHMAGAVYAFASAAEAPEHINAIVSVSGGVPIISRSQFADMSHRQRIVAYTARYTPSLLPFVVRAGINQINSGGTDRFMQSLYANSPIDMETLTDPEVSRVVLEGYKFATRQGHSAFEIDSYQVVRDWSDLVAGSDVPVSLVHGAHDPVVSARSVREFAARLGNRASLEIFEDAGQLVLHQYPDRVLDVLAKVGL